MVVQFAIKRGLKRTKVRFSPDGSVIITTDLKTSFEEMREVLERHLTPPEIRAAERLWVEDGCEREFKRKFFKLILTEKTERASE